MQEKWDEESETHLQVSHLNILWCQSEVAIKLFFPVGFHQSETAPFFLHQPVIFLIKIIFYTDMIFWCFCDLFYF